MNEGKAKEFVCPICGKKYNKFNSIQGHGLGAHGVSFRKSDFGLELDMYRCDFCGEKFYDSEIFNKHIINEHKEQSEILKKLRNRQSLKPREPSLKAPIIGGLKQCAVCGKKEDEISNKRGLLKHHISYKPEIMIWLCSQCHGQVHGGEYFATKLQVKRLRKVIKKTTIPSEDSLLQFVVLAAYLSALCEKIIGLTAMFCFEFPEDGYRPVDSVLELKEGIDEVKKLFFEKLREAYQE